MNDLEEKLSCILKDVGAQVGEIISCLVQAEIASQVAKIQQLQSVLNNTSCGGDVLSPT